MMNNKLFFISLLISLSVQSFGQDVVPRQAPKLSILLKFKPHFCQ